MSCFHIASAADLCQTMETLSVQDDLAKQVGKHMSQWRNSWSPACIQEVLSFTQVQKFLFIGYKMESFWLAQTWLSLPLTA